jgi:hypothetical protein
VQGSKAQSAIAQSLDSECDVHMQFRFELACQALPVLSFGCRPCLLQLWLLHPMLLAKAYYPTE